MTGNAIIEKAFCFEEETQLTVRKTSVFFPGDGFTVYNCKGEVVFRVDSYGPDMRDKAEVVLMDACGKCLLTVHRKRPSFHRRWEGFIGERIEGQNPIFSVRRLSIIGQSSVTVEICGKAGEEYRIEGSFSQRCCTFYNSSREIVAEIKRKMNACLVFGKDVYELCLKPGFDGAFAMALVLVLDQIAHHYNDDEDEANPVAENQQS